MESIMSNMTLASYANKVLFFFLIAGAAAAFTGCSDDWYEGDEEVTAGPMGPAGQDGTNCYDGLDDLTGDGVVNVDDCRGQDGADGIDGQDGVDGIDGQDGADGIDGQDGADGIDGQDGVDGIDGQDGADGIDGQDGADGIDGQDGADGNGFAPCPNEFTCPEGTYCGPQGICLDDGTCDDTDDDGTCDTDDLCPEHPELIDPITYYGDADADGFGDADVTTEVCETEAPEGYTTDANDECPDLPGIDPDGCPEESGEFTFTCVLPEGLPDTTVCEVHVYFGLGNSDGGDFEFNSITFDENLICDSSWPVIFEVNARLSGPGYEHMPWIGGEYVRAYDPSGESIELEVKPHPWADPDNYGPVDNEIAYCE